jgi:hypothetical protein
LVILRWAVVAALASVFVGRGATPIITTVQSPSSDAASTTSMPSGPLLSVGDRAMLAGQASGESFEATVTGYKPTLTVGEYDSPSAGHTLVGVELRLKEHLDEAVLGLALQIGGDQIRRGEVCMGQAGAVQVCPWTVGTGFDVATVYRLRECTCRAQER